MDKSHTARPEKRKGRSMVADCDGNNAGELEEEALAQAREAFGSVVSLTFDKNYTIRRNTGTKDGTYAATITVRVIEPEPEADPEPDRRSVIVTAQGDNVTELEQNALAKAAGFFATLNGNLIDLGAELEVVPDYQVRETRPFMVIEGMMPPKAWATEVTVRVAGPAKTVSRDLTKPVLVHGDFKVYRTDYDTFVSCDQGGWLPGSYSTPQVALTAYEAYDITELESLRDITDRKGRVINAGDLPVEPADPDSEENN